MSTTLPVPAQRRRVDRPVPLRPDPAAADESAMRSLARAVVALGMNALERSTLPGDYVRQNWPSDRDALMVLRAAVSPAMTASTPALMAVATAFLAALVPTSAGADLLKRGLSLNFDGVAASPSPCRAVARERKTAKNAAASRP